MVLAVLLVASAAFFVPNEMGTPSRGQSPAYDKKAVPRTLADVAADILGRECEARGVCGRARREASALRVVLHRVRRRFGG